MPMINGRYVEFDPTKLAWMMAEGHEVLPDIFDFESPVTAEERINQEWELINRALWKNHRDFWFKLNIPNFIKGGKIPFHLAPIMPMKYVPSPYREWILQDKRGLLG
ncbi:MAG: hypothetical protein AB1393_08965 [Candidatus Edwardsbacteria bacterium]